MSRKALLACALCFGLAACDKSEPVKAAPTASVALPAASSSSVASAQPVVSASAAASSAAVASNTWQGDYNAKKAKIELPKKINDETWKKDPGEAMAGPGKLSLAVSSGVVSGSASGALGEQVASGIFDGKNLHVSLLPKDPALATAMTGTAVGELVDGAIKGTLRCSGPDAVVIREASFELRPGK